MLILLSPTKNQKQVLSDHDEPLLFNGNKKHVLNALKDFSLDDIKKRYKISDTLAKDTHNRFIQYSEDSTALFTYTGEAFSSMDPHSFNEAELDYARDHLLIFSALYGLLKPFNRIGLYRLDMLTRLDMNLYEHWRDPITKYLNDQNKVLINLASKEFSSIINEDALSVPIKHIQFYNRNETGALRVVSAHAKKARGAFARTLIKNSYDSIESIVVEDYYYSHSDGNALIYIKEV